MVAQPQFPPCSSHSTIAQASRVAAQTTVPQDGWKHRKPRWQLSVLLSREERRGEGGTSRKCTNERAGRARLTAPPASRTPLPDCGARSALPALSPPPLPPRPALLFPLRWRPASPPSQLRFSSPRVFPFPRGPERPDFSFLSLRWPRAPACAPSPAMNEEYDVIVLGTGLTVSCGGRRGDVSVRPLPGPGQRAGPFGGH